MSHKVSGNTANFASQTICRTLSAIRIHLPFMFSLMKEWRCQWKYWMSLEDRATWSVTVHAGEWTWDTEREWSETHPQTRQWRRQWSAVARACHSIWSGNLRLGHFTKKVFCECTEAAWAQGDGLTRKQIWTWAGGYCRVLRQWSIVRSEHEIIYKNARRLIDHTHLISMGKSYLNILPH